MQRIPHLRVIVDSQPQAGSWNMAVDEALLETAISTGTATLRWYQWREPTISLGYFQSFDNLGSDPHLSRLPIVRRLTGGGAILHDDELTHSITLPSSQRLFEQPQELYDLVHHSICVGLRDLGFAATCRGVTLKRSDEPLLCFQRQDSHDVVVGDRKVLGSAQRRRRGCILQHGSLLRRASQLTPQIPGLVDLCEYELPSDLTEKLTIQVAETIADSWSLGVLTDKEQELSHRFCEEKITNVRLR